MFAVAVLAVLAPPNRAQAAPGYVALGDSYSAGPLIGHPAGPLGCLRSSRNYPHLVAARLGLDLRDATCSGATIRNMARPQPLFTGGTNPLQLASLRRGTRLVSLTIGGNDVGFSKILLDCIALDPFERACRRTYASGGRDLLGGRIAALAPPLAGLLGRIHARSPRAGIFLLTYPAIFAPRGGGCWPRQPFAYADVPYLRARERQLNRVLAGAAAAGGATLVDWYAASLGHDSCRPPRLRWLEPLLPGSPAAPVHPNARGMAGAAAALLDAIRLRRPAVPERRRPARRRCRGRMPRMPPLSIPR